MIPGSQAGARRWIHCFISADATARHPYLCWFLLVVLAWNVTGCGCVAAHAIAHAPNRYPTWFAPAAPVTLGLEDKFFTNFPTHFAEVGPPAARLRYRVIEPADYNLIVNSTNWVEKGKKRFQFDFDATIPAPTNIWTAKPRGTVVLLHGYALAQFAMAPWAIRLGQEGWRCVLVDLRGHGKSTGKTIYFGAREVTDLKQFLDTLERTNEVAPPVDVIGDSYGAALALRWKGEDARIHAVVAMAPYASFSNATMNIRNDYASWFPKWWLEAGIAYLPSELQVPAAEFDTTTVLRRKPVKALFIAGEYDDIAPASDVKQLEAMAAPGSRLIVVPDATHESLTYYFDDLAGPIIEWLKKDE